MLLSSFDRRVFAVLCSLFVCAGVSCAMADAQGVAEFPTQNDPAGDCGCRRGGDAIPVSSGMLTPFLPKIPNLEFGFLYSFGNNVRTGRFTADYVLPFKLSADSVLFGEAHAEGWDFWKRPDVSITTAAGFNTSTSPASNRVDLSFGGGYRTILGSNTLLGVNGFYDTSRLFNQWYSSGGVGLELAAKAAGDDAIDLNLNWYGNLFNRDVLVNAFRNKGNSFDIEAGYSHALFNQALDLRLKLVGYQFDVGAPIRGWRGGADLTTRDGMFTLRYEHGSDLINGDYNTVGGFVNVGFQLENLFSGESPFTMPEPVFRSPRNLSRMLSQKVKRNWAQPEAVRIQSGRTVGQSSECSILNGYIAYVAVLPNFPFVAPTTTTIPAGLGGATTATLCWCGLQGTPIGHFHIVVSDGTSFYVLPIIAPATPSGCVPGLTVGVPTLLAIGNGIGDVHSNSFTFDPGGGISVSFP
jgi:hypothetical protein